jgi:hypothetical protein
VEYVAEFLPFVVALLVAAAQLYVHRVSSSTAAAEAAAAAAMRLPESAAEAVTPTGDVVALGSRRLPPPTKGALRLCAAAALLAGVSVPSFAALPYVAGVLLALLGWGFQSQDPLTPILSRRRRDHPRRRQEGSARVREDVIINGGGSGGGVSQIFLQLGLCYSATHFTLLYMYQLPELEAGANDVKAEWMGLYVLHDGDAPIVSALKSAQLLSIAGLFAGLCAAGAMRGGGSGGGGNGSRDRGLVNGSESDDSFPDDGGGTTLKPKFLNYKFYILMNPTTQNTEP